MVYNGTQFPPPQLRSSLKKIFNLPNTYSWLQYRTGFSIFPNTKLVPLQIGQVKILPFVIFNKISLTPEGIFLTNLVAFWHNFNLVFLFLFPKIPIYLILQYPFDI